MPMTLHNSYLLESFIRYWKILLLLCLFVQPVFAQESQSPTVAETATAVQSSASVSSAVNSPTYYSTTASNNKVGSGSHLLSVTMALLFIVILIMAVSWFIRRFGQGVLANTSHMKIVATMPLGTRERVMLVEIGGQQLLLGVTATQINTLHVFPEPVIIASQNQAVPVSEFSRKLMSILQQKNTASGTPSGNNPPTQG